MVQLIAQVVVTYLDGETEVLCEGGYDSITMLWNGNFIGFSSPNLWKLYNYTGIKSLEKRVVTWVKHRDD